MNADAHALPETCRQALVALEQDALDLAPEVAAHLRACPACAEARVMWLAQEEVAPALAPAGYFERLPARITAKLPTRVKPLNLRPWLWAAAAVLLMAGLTGGFLAGRAHRQPVVEASLPQPPAEVREVNQDLPFQEQDEVLGEADRLTPEQLQALMERLNEKPR
jgi:hypothetical protein